VHPCVCVRAYYNPSPHHPFLASAAGWGKPCCLLKEGPVATSRGGPWEGCCSCRRHLLVMLACIAYNTLHTTALYNTASRPLHTLLAASPHYYCSFIIMMFWAPRGRVMRLPLLHVEIHDIIVSAWCTTTTNIPLLARTGQV